MDVAANCFAITEARLENYLASQPIYGDAQVVIVQPDSEYETLEDLRGCTMGVTAGQAAQSTVEKLAPEYDWEVITYEDSTAGFQDCSLGRVDAYANTVTNIEKAERAQGLEYAYPIRVGSGVWIGGGVRVMPGVSIGDGAVIASGSVVTKDIPAGVLAAGVPCRPIRPITAADRMLP